MGVEVGADVANVELGIRVDMNLARIVGVYAIDEGVETLEGPRDAADVEEIEPRRATN